MLGQESFISACAESERSGDVELFRTIGIETAKLVKKYRGSLSGEHGDRSSEVNLSLLGEANYELLKKIKASWDPGNILNPGKIVNTPLMNTQYKPGTAPILRPSMIFHQPKE
jgi:hypothetical protein